MNSQLSLNRSDVNANEDINDSEFRFKGEINCAQRLIPLLRAISINWTTVMAITSRGLKMTCEEDSKCVQSTSFIDRSLFNNYYMTDERIPQTLCFRLEDLQNVLTIFLSSQTLQSSHTLTISYSSNSDKLKLRLKDEMISTKAYIKTFNAEELIIFNMSFVNKIILSAESFIDFWKSVDTSSESVEISIKKTEPWLRFTTESERAKVHYNIDKDSEDVEQYQCTHEVCNKYKMSLLKFSLKALLNSTKLSIRTDIQGLLSLQFMIKLDKNSRQENQNSFVEYFIVPDSLQ